MSIDSPQLRVCKCDQGKAGKSFSPLALVVPLHVSPELEYLQVKWAAHLPSAMATILLKEILPVDQAISTSRLRNRVWAVGRPLDYWVESAKRGQRHYPPANSNVKIVATGSGFRMAAPPAFMPRVRRRKAVEVFLIEAPAANWATREHQCRQRSLKTAVAKSMGTATKRSPLQ